MKYRKRILLCAVAFFFMCSVSYFYYLHSTSVSFVDEFDNIVAANFMVKGKPLFAGVFHNRQLGAPYISYLIQQTLHPPTLYQLITYHRMFVAAFSFGMVLLIVWRFGLTGLLAAALFEVIKLNSFGNFFQAESLIVYPVLYVFGLLTEVMNGRKPGTADLILAGIFTWFIVFSRETYIPLALLMFGIIILKQKDKKAKAFSIASPVVLAVFTLASVSLKDYLYQVFYVNTQVKLFRGEVNILRSMFYPLYIFFPAGPLSYTRIIELLTAAVFVMLLVKQIVAGKVRETLLVVIILGIACLRAIVPGTEMYPAYKMLVWYILFFFITFNWVTGLFGEKMKTALLRNISLVIVLVVFGYAFFMSSLFKGVDRNTEFDISYNRYFANGEVINMLSAPGDTLFVDGYDSLLYWQARTPPSYKYVIYYPILEGIQPYDRLRMDMFRNNPPTFYYRDCLSKNNLVLPDFVRDRYVNFKGGKSFSCLFVMKSKLGVIEGKKQELKSRFGYEL